MPGRPTDQGPALPGPRRVKRLWRGGHGGWAHQKSQSNLRPPPRVSAAFPLFVPHHVWSPFAYGICRACPAVPSTSSEGRRHDHSPWNKEGTGPATPENLCLGAPAPTLLYQVGMGRRSASAGGRGGRAACLLEVQGLWGHLQIAPDPHSPPLPPWKSAAAAAWPPGNVVWWGGRCLPVGPLGPHVAGWVRLLRQTQK